MTATDFPLLALFFRILALPPEAPALRYASSAVMRPRSVAVATPAVSALCIVCFSSGVALTSSTTRLSLSRSGPARCASAAAFNPNS